MRHIYGSPRQVVSGIETDANPFLNPLHDTRHHPEFTEAPELTDGKDERSSACCNSSPKLEEQALMVGLAFRACWKTRGKTLLRLPTQQF